MTDSLQKLADSMNATALANSSDPARASAYRDCAKRVERHIQQAPPRVAKGPPVPKYIPADHETRHETFANPFVPEPSDSDR